jgi:hypothetical protein
MYQAKLISYIFLSYSSLYTLREIHLIKSTLSKISPYLKRNYQFLIEVSHQLLSQLQREG